MKKACLLSIIVLSLTYANTADKINTLSGTWCADENGLILTFSGKDTVSVASVSDSSVKGMGTYHKTDSTFTATINNNDIIMKMQYRYHWKGKDSIQAQAMIFTVNGDTVESPKEWTTMTRCSKSLPVKKTDQKQKKNTTPTKNTK